MSNPLSRPLVAYESIDSLPAYVSAGIHRFLDDRCILAITDIRGDIVFANDAFCRISGFSRDQLLGQNHRLLKSGCHGPEFYRTMWQTIARGETWTGEVCNRARDGRLYWVESTLAPIQDSAGRTTHYCALRVDITERKEAQQRLLDAMELGAERRHLESLGRMADGILHDLNNLLGGAMMLAELDEGAARSGETQRSFLLRMAQLIRNVRDFSTGRTVELKECAAAEAIGEACRLASFVARRERDIAIDLDLAALEACTLCVNEAQLLEVVLNLFTNAAEALRERPDPRITVAASADLAAGCVHLHFRDNGPGVPREVAPQLFEPFVSSKGRGRGVGLAGARRIARDLQGDLTLVPSNGGACFLFSLPATTRVRPENAAEPLVQAAGDAGLVLIADDDPRFLSMLTIALHEYGFRTIAATEADEAIVKAGQFRGCLSAAILDSVGCVKDHALVGVLRSAQPELPVVIVSGGLSRSGVEQTGHGPVHLLPKPFAASDLMALLDPGHQDRGD